MCLECLNNLEYAAEIQSEIKRTDSFWKMFIKNQSQNLLQPLKESKLPNTDANPIIRVRPEYCITNIKKIDNEKLESVQLLEQIKNDDYYDIDSVNAEEQQSQQYSMQMELNEIDYEVSPSVCSSDLICYSPVTDDFELEELIIKDEYEDEDTSEHFENIFEVELLQDEQIKDELDHDIQLNNKNATNEPEEDSRCKLKEMTKHFSKLIFFYIF